MDELRGDRATWQFDGRSIHVRFHTGRSQDPVLAALGRPRLAGPSGTRLVAEYWANEIAAAADHAAGGSAGPGSPVPVSPEVALGFVPPVPLHIQTGEGTAAFDGATIRLVWSGSSAGRRKRRKQRGEFPLSDLAAPLDQAHRPGEPADVGVERVVLLEVVGRVGLRQPTPGVFEWTTPLGSLVHGQTRAVRRVHRPPDP